MTRFTPARRAVLVTSALLALAAPSAVPAGAASPPPGAIPAASAAAPGRVVVSSGFAGTALPSGFKAVEGTWQVKNGRLYGTSTGSAQQSRITFGQHLVDFRIEVTARFESAVDSARWAALGLDVPAAGTPPWSIATLRTGSTAANGLEFAQRTTANAWNVTDTAAAPSAAGTGKDVRIAAEVHGTQAVWYFNGKEVMRTGKAARSAAGVQALLVNGASVSFDDLVVTELAPSRYLRAPGAPLTVIGHRGASAVAPENTLVSDQAARDGGAAYIENDVQPSKDGVPYVMHDATVDRTTNGTGAIRALTSAQLNALDAGSWFGAAFAGEHVPTLAAQLDDVRVRGGDLLLEIKGAHTKAEVATVVDTVRAHGMAGRVFVQSFEVDALRYTRELAPELPLGLLRSTLDSNPVALARELGLSSYNPSDAALSTKPGVVNDLHAAGVGVMVWTVDTADRWQKLGAAKADGIITNKPADLTRWNGAHPSGS